MLKKLTPLPQAANATKDFLLDVDGQQVKIPVSHALMAHFHEQFKTSTENQRNRLKTLKELMRAAYRQTARRSI